MEIVTLDPKDPDVSATYSIDWHDELITEAWRRYDFAVGAVVYYPRDEGWYFEVTTAGRTGTHYPHQLPRAAGQTVNDGSAVLTCRHPSTPTVPQVSSASWTVPSGITQDSSSVDGTLTHIVLSGGTDGMDYDILCRMTPTIGSVKEKTITVQVRSQ